MPFDQGKAKPVDAEVKDVDLRNISNENLSIDIGGKTVQIVEKARKSLDDPYNWIIRFVPPDQRSKNAEVEYVPRCPFRKYTASTCILASFPRKWESRRPGAWELDARLRGHDVLLASDL